jgi:hypothetical protein
LAANPAFLQNRLVAQVKSCRAINCFQILHGRLREQLMTTPKIALKVFIATRIGHIMDAPPVLKASECSIITRAATAARLCCTPRKAKFTAC